MCILFILKTFVGIYGSHLDCGIGQMEQLWSVLKEALVDAFFLIFQPDFMVGYP